MRHKLTMAFAFTVLSLFFYSASASDTLQSREQIAQGKKLYMSYCASCHGVDGAGSGSVAPSLKQRPPDLRRIQAKVGRFPAEEVRKQISGALTVPVHGSRDMPVWGMILSRADINNLVLYLESIQRPYEMTPGN